MLPSRQALENSAQSFPPQGWLGAGPFIAEYFRGPYLPPVGLKERDYRLRQYDRDESNGMWMGASSGVIKNIVSVPYDIDGPPSLVQYYQDILGYAHFGHGWQYLMKLVLRDYITQSYGGIFEIAGPGDANTPLMQAPTGINHLDAGRCYVTGNPEFPLIYYSLWDGRLHRMHASRVYMMVDDPNPDERYFGIGRCALERALSTAIREMRMSQYIDAMLDDKPQPGILGLKGVNDTQWQEKLAQYLMQQQNDDRPVFGKTLVLTNIDPTQEAMATVIPFSQTPAKFDFVDYVDLDVNSLALAFGIDRQEIWQLSSGSLGSGSQSSVLSMKSRGKFYGDVRAALTRMMNWAILPENCEFKFDFHDDQENAAQTAIDLQLTQAATALAAIPGVSPLEVKTFLSNRSDSFKDVFTNEDGIVTLGSTDPQTVQQIAADSEAQTFGAPATPHYSKPPTSQPQPTAIAGRPGPAPTPALIPATTKAFGTTAALFSQRFAEVLQSLASGQVTKPQADMLIRGLLLNSGGQAFTDGLVEGGVTDELGDDDRQQIQNLLLDADGYIAPVLDEVAAGQLTPDQIQARSVIWANKSLTDFYRAGQISADRDGMYRWVLGDTEQHCVTCKRLAGQVHRFGRWYAKSLLPQSSALACGGWRCSCILIKTTEPAQGRF